MACLICSACFWPLADAAFSMTISFAVLRFWSLLSGHSGHHQKVLPQKNPRSSSDTGDGMTHDGEWQLYPRRAVPSRTMDFEEQFAEMIHENQKMIQAIEPRDGPRFPHSCEIPKPLAGPSSINPQKMTIVHNKQNISFPTYDNVNATDLLEAVDRFSSSSSCVWSENDSDMDMLDLSTCLESGGACEVMSRSSEIQAISESLARQPFREPQWKKTANQTYKNPCRNSGILPECPETPSSWHDIGYASNNPIENQCPFVSNFTQENTERSAEVAHENHTIIQPTEPNNAVSRRPFCRNPILRDRTSSTKPQNIRCVPKKLNVTFRTNDQVKVKDSNVHYCYSTNGLLTDTSRHLATERRMIVQNTQVKTVATGEDEGATHEKLQEVPAFTSSNKLARLPYNNVSWNSQGSGDQKSRSAYFCDLAKKLTILLGLHPQLSPVSFEDRSTKSEIFPVSRHEVLDTDLKNGHSRDLPEERVKDPFIPFKQMTHMEGLQSEYSDPLESFIKMNEALECPIQRKKRLNVSDLAGLIHQSFLTYIPPALALNASQKNRRPAVLWVPLLSKLVFFSADAQNRLEFHIQKITAHIKLGQPARIQESVEDFANLLWQEDNNGCQLPCQVTESLLDVSTERGSTSASFCDMKEKDIMLMSPTSIVEEVYCASPVSTFPHQLTSKEDHMRLIHILKEFLSMNMNRIPLVTKRPIEAVRQKRQPNLPMLLSTGERKLHPLSKCAALLGVNPRGHAKLADQRLSLSSLWALSNPYMCSLAGLIPRAPAPSSPIATYNAQMEFSDMKTISHSTDVKQILKLHKSQERQQVQDMDLFINQKSLKTLLPPDPLPAPKGLRLPETEAVVVIGKLSFVPGEEIRSIELKIGNRKLEQTCEQPKTEQESLRLFTHPSPPATNAALTYAADAKKHLLLELGESSSSTSSLQGPSKATCSATAFSAPEVMQNIQFHLVRKNVEIQMQSLPPRVKKSHGLVYVPEKSPLPKLVPTYQLPLRECKKFDLCVCKHTRNRIEQNIKCKHVASLFRLPTVYSESLDKIIDDSPGPPFLDEGGGVPAELLERQPTPSMQSNAELMVTHPPATPEIIFETSEIQFSEMNTPYNTSEPRDHPEIQTEENIMQEKYSHSPLHHPNSPGMDYHSPGMDYRSSGMNYRSPGMDDHSPGMDDHSPGMDCHSPGMDCRSPGMDCRSPGMDDRSPGMDDRSPGMDDRSPGMDDRSPGMDDHSPGMDCHSPGMDFHSPGIDDRSPGMDDRSPGIDDRSPGMSDRSPGMSDRSPGMDDHSPGMDDHSPGMDCHSPGMDCHSPGMDCHSPGMDCHSPGMDDRSPGMDDRSPGMDYHSPGMDYHSSGMDDHSPGMDDHSPGMDDHSQNLNTNASCNASSMYDDPQAQIPQLTNVFCSQICRKQKPKMHLEPHLDALDILLDEIECADNFSIRKSIRKRERMMRIEDSLENRPVFYPDADTARSSLEAGFATTNGPVTDVQGPDMLNENYMRDVDSVEKFTSPKVAISDQSKCNVFSDSPGSSVGQETELIPSFLQLIDDFCTMPSWFKKNIITEKQAGPSASDGPSLSLNTSHVKLKNKAEVQMLKRASHMQRDSPNSSLKEYKMRSTIRAEQRALGRKSERPRNGLRVEERPATPESRLEKSLRTLVPQKEHKGSTSLKEPYLGTTRRHERSWPPNEEVGAMAAEVPSALSMKESEAGNNTGHVWAIKEKQTNIKHRYNMWLLSKDYRATHQRPPNPNRHSCSLLSRLLG